MRSKDIIELQNAIRAIHECESRWEASVRVEEKFEGNTAWNGIVEVFALISNPKAKYAYAWTYRDRNQNKTTAVLKIPPVDSPQSAVKVAIASKVRQITATEGGGLLGNLLCSLGNLLNQGLTINQALATFSPSDLNTLLGGITGLLNGALGNLNQATLISITQVGVHHTCAILHLELGPLNLTLLGLNVVLDNCANGPITVDITAVTGQGNLLGNLLCELLGGGLINIGATLQDILNQILALLRQ